MEYDTVTFKWKIPMNKATLMLDSLYKIVDGESISNQDALKLAGRLNHYFPLIPGGRWERFWVGRLGDGEVHRARMMRPCSLARSQAAWWIANLQLGLGWNRIPELERRSPHNFVGLYPDAAGGSDMKPHLGLGGCIMEGAEIPWVYLPWPLLVRENRSNEDGEKFASKLSVLEAVAALALMSSEPALLKGRAVRIFTDNKGFYYSYNKGYSSDPYLMTVVMALSAMARALDINLWVRWTPRRSGLGERVADDLSKADFRAARENIPRLSKEPSDISRTLISWIENPIQSRVLGQAMVEECSRITPVLRWNLENSDEVQVLTKYRKRKANWQLMK